MLAGKYFDISNSTGSFFYSVLIVNYTVLPEVGYFSMKYFILSKVYTDEGGVNSYTKGCPPVREIIASLNLLVQAENRGMTIINTQELILCYHILDSSRL